MLTLSLLPNAITVDEPTDVLLRLTNTGITPCTSIRLTLSAPTQLVVLCGDQRLHIDRLDGGYSCDHPLRLRSQEPGTLALRAASISYRTSDGEIVHDSESVTLTVSHRAITMDRRPDSSEMPGVACGDSSDLTMGERRRLTEDLARLQTEYERATKRIEALDIDIGRALDSERRQILEERRSQRALTRQSIEAEMLQIERRLDGRSSSNLRTPPRLRS